VLPGPLPAGNIHVYASGYMASHDATLHADVYWQGTGGQMLLGSLDGRASPDGGATAYLDASFASAAVPAQCGDKLLLHITLVSAGSNFIEFGVAMDLP
jgi:hypothetical protein